jgi:hypothetical protein
MVFFFNPLAEKGIDPGEPAAGVNFRVVDLKAFAKIAFRGEFLSQISRITMPVFAALEL